MRLRPARRNRAKWPAATGADHTPQQSSSWCLRALGDLLRAARESAGMPLDIAAEAGEVSERALHHLETGRWRTPVPTGPATALARAVGADVDAVCQLARQAWTAQERENQREWARLWEESRSTQNPRPAPAEWEDSVMQNLLREHDFAGVFSSLGTRGCSQVVIAACCGITQPQVSAIAGGKRSVISWELISRIADGLDIPRGYVGVAWALDGAEVADDAAADDAVWRDPAVSGQLRVHNFRPLFERMVASGLRQRDIATMIGEPQQVVSVILRGLQGPPRTWRLFRAIADGLGIPPGWLGVAWHDEI
jgi:transcriptional regulator with XRE-family HTH domain